MQICYHLNVYKEGRFLNKFCHLTSLKDAAVAKGVRRLEKIEIKKLGEIMR